VQKRGSSKKDRPLTKEEEDAIMRAVDVETPDPIKEGVEVYPGFGQWFTASDQKFTDAEWQQVMERKKYVYIFAEMKYFVRNVEKTTEHCVLLTRDFPAVHSCIGHTRTYNR
jgi:hypothetical protein